MLAKQYDIHLEKNIIKMIQGIFDRVWDPYISNYTNALSVILSDHPEIESINICDILDASTIKVVSAVLSLNTTLKSLEIKNTSGRLSEDHLVKAAGQNYSLLKYSGVKDEEIQPFVERNQRSPILIKFYFIFCHPQSPFKRLSLDIIQSQFEKLFCQSIHRESISSTAFKNKIPAVPETFFKCTRKKHKHS